MRELGDSSESIGGWQGLGQVGTRHKHNGGKGTRLRSPRTRPRGPWRWLQPRRQPWHPPVTTRTPPRRTGSPGLRSSAPAPAGGRGSRAAECRRVSRSAAGTRRSPPGAGCLSRRSLSRGSTGRSPTCPEVGETGRGQGMRGQPPGGPSACTP